MEGVFKTIDKGGNLVDSDKASLSTACLAFLMVLDSPALELCAPETKTKIKELVGIRFCSISCNAHALAYVLDPAMPPVQVLSNRQWFDKNVVLVAIDAAKEIQRTIFQNCSSEMETELASEIVSLASNSIAGFKNASEQCTRSHPLMFWSLYAPPCLPRTTAIAKALFCMYPGSGGVERSFKTRSIVHSKTRNRLEDGAADAQSFLYYNQQQLQRASKHDLQKILQNR